MTTPLFIATERFDPSDGEKWQKYCEWAKIRGLVEVVSLDAMLCKHLVNELQDEDWHHNVKEDFRLGYFYHLDYLTQRIQDIPRKKTSWDYIEIRRFISQRLQRPGDFGFVGYDLIEEETQISALTNCGGFPDVFGNEELNRFGLVCNFDRACEVKQFACPELPGRTPCSVRVVCHLEIEWERTRR